MTARKRAATPRTPVTGPTITVGKVPADAETPVQTEVDAPVENTEETWISYTDDAGKVQRIPVSKYHEKGLG